LNHVLLFTFYFAYLVLGASIFYILEHDSSDHFRDQWRQKVKEQRDGFVMSELLPDIFNNSRFLVFIHDKKSQYFINILQDKLATYEQRLKIRPPMPYLEWTFANSFLYCWSTITTIGHGYIYPVTDRGRVASIIYSLFGIPFTIVVIKDLAYLIAKLLNYPGVVLGYCWHMFRYCTLRPVNELYLRRKCDDAKKLNINPDYRIQSIRRLLNIPAVVAIFALIGWLSAGSFLMVVYEEHMSASVAFYYLFNTLATT
uniref:Potassium channel domain-containing protein n=1 Tax=Plectus sambesii TaxID=2011161 RepID=A0A914VG02_9BILA